MAKNKFSIFGGLGLVYANYGGLWTVLSSRYFIATLIIAGLCWKTVSGEDWIPTAIAVLPSLAGFSIAAYALIFSVLSGDALDALSAPSEELKNRSPILMVASAISHAVVVQILAVVIALVIQSKPVDWVPAGFSAHQINLVWSSLGLVVFVYGLMLVIGAVVSVFQLLEIRTRIARHKKPGRSAPPARESPNDQPEA